MTNHRVSRGRKTQELVAQYLRVYWPDAKSRPASLPGTDIYDIPFAVEVKATEQISFTGALRQAENNAIHDQLPMVVYRPRGYGPERIGDWLAVLKLCDAVELMNEYYR